MTFWLLLLVGGCSDPKPTSRWEGWERGQVQSDVSLATYRAGGGDRTLVALHGGPGAPGTLYGFDRLSSADLTVVTFDQRGTGASAKPGNPARYRMSDYVADTLSVVQAASPDRPVDVVGHSWGAAVALAFASAHPERVRTLILVGAPAPTRDDQLRLLAQSERDERPVPPPPDLPPGCEGWWDDFVSGYADPSLARASHLPERCHPEVFRLTKQAVGIDSDLGRYLDAVTAPLLVFGDSDPRLYGWRSMSASLVVLPRCGHRPMFECPDEFYPVVQAHVGSH